MKLIPCVCWLAIVATGTASHDTFAGDTATLPAGYRMADYDALVPQVLDGATVVSDEQVFALHKGGALLVDVIPELRPPDALPDNQIWMPPPHQSIPGALWLPDTGYGKLQDVTLEYFRTHLSAATEGDTLHPLVFFCRDNCWMSWNAAKRALELGYRNVHWYPEGTDGWFAAGYDMQPVEAAPGARR